VILGLWALVLVIQVQSTKFKDLRPKTKDLPYTFLHPLSYANLSQLS